MVFIYYTFTYVCRIVLLIAGIARTIAQANSIHILFVKHSNHRHFIWG